MNCDWLTDAGDPRVKTCRREGCRNRITSDYPAAQCFAECRSPHAAPPLARRAFNFVAAAFRQAPLFAEAALTGDSDVAFRSQEEIERLAGICKACPLLVDGVCTHKACGCAVSEDRSAFWSKLAWKSQGCPDGRWS